MASSSDEALDDSIPEMVYQCTSLIDGTGSKREDYFLKCPLCNQFSRCFYCIDCVRNGNFTHSEKKCFERFADKKPKKYKLDEEKNEILKKYEDILAKKKEAENIKFNIIRHKERIHLLKQSIDARKKEMERDAKAIKVFQEENQIQKAEQEKLSHKISLLRDANKLANAKTEAMSTELSRDQSAFQNISQKWICELKSCIFPIIKTPPRYHRNATSSEEGQCAELEEAQKTTYVQGQWVITGSPIDDIQYAIMDALVPSTGDYSAYTNWCSEHEPLAIYRGDWSNLDRHHFDIAYGISSGLAYAAQLVNVLAFYLDVHVPKRSNFNDFCRYEDAMKFSHHVAKLNANIVHLCLHRQVDVSKLSAHRTMPNLVLIFDPKTYESHRAITQQEKEELLESLEDSICKDLLPAEESDDEIDADFEYITTDDVPKADTPASTSTLFSSVVSSIYRVAIGRR